MQTDVNIKNDQALDIVSDLSKTLLGADRCVIFHYDAGQNVMVSLYNDFSDDTIVLQERSALMEVILAQKKAIVTETSEKSLDFLPPDMQDGSILLYPVCDDAGELKGMLLFFKEGERRFRHTDIALIDPMQRYLVRMIGECSAHACADEGLGREIVLAIWNHTQLDLSIQQDLQSFANAELFLFSHFEELRHRIKINREKSFIVIAPVETMKEIDAIGQEVFQTNLPVILLGPDDDDLILAAGKYNVTSYLPLPKYTREKMERKIHDNYQKIIKNPQSTSRLSLFIGTTGGTGTTTISANLANVLSMRYPMKNILYLDFSMTKGISNIFFGLPAPQKSIVDFIDIDDYSEAHMLQSGLYQVRNNLYLIPGIQSHVEREALFSEEKSRKIIDMLYEMKQLFDYVIIDGGVAHDSELQIAVEEISDQIFIVTELTTIHISILQTYYELMKKAGWKDKVKIVLNREDSQNAISVRDASEILNSRKSKDISFDIHIPNGGSHIRECWNFGKLITSEYPGVKFSKAIQESQFFSDLESEFPDQAPKKGLIQKIFGKRFA